MLSQDYHRTTTVRLTRRIFRPGTALRVFLAIVAVLYLAGPTALQWAAYSGLRNEVAAERAMHAPATTVAQTPVSTPILTPAAARPGDPGRWAEPLVDHLRDAAPIVVPITTILLVSMIVLSVRAGRYQPRHARRRAPLRRP